MLELPWFVLSAVVVIFLADLAGFDPWGAIIIAAWLASGTLTLIRAVEDRVVSAMFSLRRPTPAEQHRLALAWRAVARSAVIDPDDYTLWIQDSHRLNAFAAAGHTVAVTEATIRLRTSAQLEAVLAHELGHHLGGHSWTGLLRWWYSLPAIYTMQFAGYLTLSINAAIATSGWVMLAVVGIIVVAFLVLVTTAVPVLGILLVVLLVAPFVSLWFRRIQEREADRMATDLGYGPALIAVMEPHASPSQPEGRPALRRLARIAATHPDHDERIRLINQRLQ